jgi:glycerophosphoryl diester phosphodiesterase
MRWLFPQVIAHRGGGRFAPENTIQSITCGRDAGYKGVEFDVMLTKDKVPVLMHDDVVGRTIKSAHRSISDLTLDEIISLDAGSWYDAKYSAVRVPKFEDVLQFCHQNNIWMNIEIKPAPGFERETGEVVAQTTKDFFARHSLPEEQLPLFSSFAFDSLKAAYAVAPSFKRGYLIDDIMTEVPDWREKCAEIAAYSVNTNHETLNRSLASEIKNEGFGLFCYTVNTVAKAHEIMDWGVDAFCTDELEIFKDFSKK